MASKTRLQAIDPTPVFAMDGEARAAALRTQVLPRLTGLKEAALNEANGVYDFEIARDSDEAVQVDSNEVATGIHPAQSDYTGLRNIHTPAFSLMLVANEEGLNVAFRITGAAEWRLFIKAIYQFRESLGDYLSEFDELYLVNSEGEEEVIEELDQLFGVDVEAEQFKASGCAIYFPSLDYPVETEEDFATITGDFATLFPLYWTLLKAAKGEPVDMDRLLNG